MAPFVSVRLWCSMTGKEPREVNDRLCALGLQVKKADGQFTYRTTKWAKGYGEEQPPSPDGRRNGFVTWRSDLLMWAVFGTAMSDPPALPRKRWQGMP